MSDNWISVSEAAQLLNVSVDTIRRLAKSGDLTSKRKTTLQSSSIMISLSSVTKFDNQRSKTS